MNSGELCRNDKMLKRPLTLNFQVHEPQVGVTLVIIAVAGKCIVLTKLHKRPKSGGTEYKICLC